MGCYACPKLLIPIARRPLIEYTATVILLGACASEPDFQHITFAEVSPPRAAAGQRAACN